MRPPLKLVLLAAFGLSIPAAIQAQPTCVVSPADATLELGQKAQFKVTITESAEATHWLTFPLQYNNDPSGKLRFADDARPIVRSLYTQIDNPQSLTLVRGYDLNYAELSDVEIRHATRYPGSVTERVLLIFKGGRAICRYSVKLVPNAGVSLDSPR